MTNGAMAQCSAQANDVTTPIRSSTSSPNKPRYPRNELPLNMRMSNKGRQPLHKLICSGQIISPLCRRLSIGRAGRRRLREVPTLRSTGKQARSIFNEWQLSNSEQPFVISHPSHAQIMRRRVYRRSFPCRLAWIDLAVVQGYATRQRSSCLSMKEFKATK